MHLNCFISGCLEASQETCLGVREIPTHVGIDYLINKTVLIRFKIGFENRHGCTGIVMS